MQFNNITEIHNSFPALISLSAAKTPLKGQFQFSLVTTDKTDPRNFNQDFIGIVCNETNNVNLVDCDIVKAEDVKKYEEEMESFQQHATLGYYEKNGHIYEKPPNKPLMKKCGVK